MSAIHSPELASRQGEARQSREGGVAPRLQRIANHGGFQSFIVATILFSSMLVGIESMPEVKEDFHLAFAWAERLVLTVFVVELVIRIGAYGRQPWRFFADGWNVFDFVIIALCFVPQAYFTSVLRILRLLRLIRLLKVANKAQQAEIYRLKHDKLEQAYQALVNEQEKSERLLLNILPLLVAQRLKSGEKLIADSYPEASVLFADIVGFTDFSSRISPEELVTYLDDIFRRFDALAERHGLEKIKTIGDCYMVVAGLPDFREDHASVLADMAIDMQDAVDDFNRDRDLELQIRVGINSGPVVAGVIGQKKFIYDLWGDTVNTASRMESHGVPGRIQITEATRQLLPADYPTEERGMISVKGKGKVRSYFLLRGQEESLTWEDLIAELKRSLPAGKVTSYRNLSIWAYGNPYGTRSIVALLRNAVEEHHADALWANRVVTRDGQVHDLLQLKQLREEGVPTIDKRVDMGRAEVVGW